MTDDGIKKDNLGGTGGTHGRTEKYIYYLVEIHGRRRPLGRTEHRWEDIIYVFSPYHANVESMVSS